MLSCDVPRQLLLQLSVIDDQEFKSAIGGELGVYDYQ
jgi:hypothetical protein